MLDVATGTGDLAIEIARRVSPAGEVVGADFAEGMLDRARAKAAALDAPPSVRPRFEWADAIALPYPDNSFDAATVGFGVRNFENLAAGLAEMVRIVRPAGRVVVLEMTTPTRPPLSLFFGLWFDRIVPVLGRLTAALALLAGRHDATRAGTIANAYSYLPKLSQALPRPGGASGRDGARGPVGDQLRADRRRNRGHPRRHRSPRAGIMSAVSSRGASIPAGEVDGLDAIMHHGGEGLRRRMERTERHLERVTAQAGTPLASHANATVVAGGKRLRPLLVVLAAESAGGPPDTPDGEERLVRAAVAVELVHSATLVHDDLIDGALLRRGHPTVAAAAGRQMAVATGDLLFSRAFAELARNRDAAQLRALSQASSALAEGELLQREDAYAAHVPVERYLRRCELKTAALFDAACRLGALTAVEGSSTLAEALGAFARRIGLAFQMLDDVLDVSGPVERTGKSRGTDLLDGTVTLPFILARSASRSSQRSSSTRCAGRPGTKRPRRCASASRRPARWSRRGSRRWRWSPRRRPRCRRSSPTGARAC